MVKCLILGIHKLHCFQANFSVDIRWHVRGSNTVASWWCYVKWIMFQQQRISIKKHSQTARWTHCEIEIKIKIDMVWWIMRMNVIRRNEGISLVLNHVPSNRNSIVLHCWFYMRGNGNFGGAFSIWLASATKNSRKKIVRLSNSWFIQYNVEIYTKSNDLCKKWKWNSSSSRNSHLLW